MAFSYSTPFSRVSSGSVNTSTFDPNSPAMKGGPGYRRIANTGFNQFAPISGYGTPGAPSSAPATPASAAIQNITAQNQPQVSQEIGKTAASLADPFAEQRPQYQQQLANLMRNPGEFASSPAYKFAFEQGMEGVNRTAAAKGQLGSGNRLLDLTKFGQGLAGQQYFQQADLLSGLAGSKTSSPAAAGISYARGATGGIDAFNQQEMERAYADALRNAGTPNATPAGGGSFVGSNLPPLAPPLSTDPTARAYQQQTAGAPSAYPGYGGGGGVGLLRPPADAGGLETEPSGANAYFGDPGLYPGGFGVSESSSLGYGEGDYNPAVNSGSLSMINAPPPSSYTGTQTFGDWDSFFGLKSYILGERG